MATFSYSARDKAGLIQKGSLFAPDRAAATASLAEKGLTPILVKEAALTSSDNMGLVERLTGGNRVKLADTTAWPAGI